MIFGRNIQKTRIEFACFSFHVGLLFLSNFCLSNWTPKITHKFSRCIEQTWQLWCCSVKGTKFGSKICTIVKVAMLGSITKFWTKIERRTALTGCWWSSEQLTGISGQRQMQCAYWWKRRHSWVAVAASGRQTLEPPNSQRNFTWGEVHQS